jgi:hypothetical protein
MALPVPHPNVVLFDVRVGFHCRAKLGILLGENPGTDRTFPFSSQSTVIKIIDFQPTVRENRDLIGAVSKSVH